MGLNTLLQYLSMNAVHRHRWKSASEFSHLDRMTPVIARQEG